MYMSRKDKKTDQCAFLCFSFNIFFCKSTNLSKIQRSIKMKTWSLCFFLEKEQKNLAENTSISNSFAYCFCILDLCQNSQKYLSNSFAYSFCIFENSANSRGSLAFMQVRPRLGKHQSAASLYIAMVHAGLATALLVLYGLYLLLALPLAAL